MCFVERKNSNNNMFLTLKRIWREIFRCEQYSVLTDVMYAVLLRLLMDPFFVTIYIGMYNRYVKRGHCHWSVLDILGKIPGITYTP